MLVLLICCVFFYIPIIQTKKMSASGDKSPTVSDVDNFKNALSGKETNTQNDNAIKHAKQLMANSESSFDSRDGSNSGNESSIGSESLSGFSSGMSSSSDIGPDDSVSQVQKKRKSRDNEDSRDKRRSGDSSKRRRRHKRESKRRRRHGSRHDDRKVDLMYKQDYIDKIVQMYAPKGGVPTTYGGQNGLYSMSSAELRAIYVQAQQTQLKNSTISNWSVTIQGGAGLIESVTSVGMIKKHADCTGLSEGVKTAMPTLSTQLDALYEKDGPDALPSIPPAAMLSLSLARIVVDVVRVNAELKEQKAAKEKLEASLPKLPPGVQMTTTLDPVVVPPVISGPSGLASAAMETASTIAPTDMLV